MIITDADAKIAEIYVCKLLNIKKLQKSNMELYLKTNLVIHGIKVIKIITLYYQYQMKSLYLVKTYSGNIKFYKTDIFYQKILLFQRT